MNKSLLRIFSLTFFLALLGAPIFSYANFNQTLAQNIANRNLEQIIQTALRDPARPVLRLSHFHYYDFLRNFIRTGLLIIIFALLVYTLRHYVFAFNRLFGYQRNLYAEIIEARWPTVSVIVPAHNEELVIGNLLSALLEAEYPTELLQIIVVNDRSTDQTAGIIDNFVQRYPARITAFHRNSGVAGKAAALKDALELIKNEIIIVFDADNLPGRFLIKQLVSPFFDPEVGAVMGRAVPGNTNSNLLTRLLDMERSAGYQVNQQARENLRAVPQYGGTAGGIRSQALQAVGGWQADSLAEDTEITFRLLCQGWKTVYQNNCECLEQVPESWAVRIKQIRRWAKGHNQVMFRYFSKVVFNKNINLLARLDGLLLLGLFMMSPVLLFGWLLYILAFYLNVFPFSGGTILALFAMISYSGAGNFSIFYEVSTAVHLDNLRGVQGNRIRLLPINYFNFFVSMFALCRALIEQIFIDPFRRELVWDKTERYQINTAKGKTA